jgi:membrane-associated phospholipid phosphatase
MSSTAPVDPGEERVAVATGARFVNGRQWISEVRAQADALDEAIVQAVEGTPTPALDRSLVRLSNAANRSRLWLVTAGVVAAAGGTSGRRAAGEAVAAIGMASAVSNLVLKPLRRRRRPEVPADGRASPSREVRRPTSSSFPSGHAASAFAFASSMGEAVPPMWVPLHVAAALVAYARVHTGVHYPSDVVVGSLVGAFCGWTVRRLSNRWMPPALSPTQSRVCAG